MAQTSREVCAIAFPETLTPKANCGIFSPMNITAIVENDTIKLPVHVPDGTSVEIILPQERKAEGGALGWMKEFAGSIDTLPADAAERHTEMVHGRKRQL